MMNKLTDYLEADLKNAGVKVYRNKSTGNINEWLKESNNKKVIFILLFIQMEVQIMILKEWKYM